MHCDVLHSRSFSSQEQSLSVSLLLANVAAMTRRWHVGMAILLMLSGQAIGMEQEKWDSSSQQWSRKEGWTEDGWSSGDWKSNDFQSTGWTDYADPRETRQRGSACKSRRRSRSRTATSDGEWEMPSIDRLVINDPWRAESSSSPARGEEGVDARQGGDPMSPASTKPWRAESSSSPVRGEDGVEARQGGDTKSMVSTM